MLNQGGGGAQSIASALDLEVQGAIADTRKQIMRQIVGNGDALIAVCASGSANTALLLGVAGYGYDAIARGWLYPGLTIDVGTTADEVAVGDAVEITAVTEDAAAPALTLGTSVTEGTTHYVSIANARSGTTSYEMNGLRQIFGSSTSAVGGLDPDTAGEEFWKPASVQTGTSLTIDMLLDMQRATYQKGGAAGYYILTSLKQQANLYALLQTQVRFTSDSSIGAGNVNQTKWNGMEINALPDIPDRELYLIHLDDLLLVTGKYNKPTWISDVEGRGGPLRHVQDTTAFGSALFYGLNLGVKRRNSSASNVSLTA